MVSSARFLKGAVAAVALAATLSLPAIAGPWLSDSEIEQALKGQTLEGMYASGRRFTERYLAGGDVEYTEDGTTIRGHWSVTADTLCTIYDTDPTGGCFRVAASAKNCFEFYFVARTEAAAPGPPDSKPDWTARGAINGEIEACKEEVNV